MKEATGGAKDSGQGRLTTRTILAALALLVVAIAAAVALNVGGLRDRLVGRFGAPPVRAVAVLPFDNLSGDSSQDYLAAGLTEELTYDLSLVGTYRVTASASAGKYKKGAKTLPEIARILNVGAVVQGGVQRTGAQVRVAVTLTRVPANERVWEHVYQRDLGDTPIVLGEISRAVTAAIGAAIPTEQDGRFRATRQVNPAALDAYLKASYGGRDATLEQAIALDPAFAPPVAALAGNYYWSNFWPTFPPGDTYPKVKKAAQQALVLDPANAPAHFYSALVAMDYDWDFVEAENQFKRNLALRNNCSDTHHLYAHFLLSMGRNEEARAESERAMEIDPVDAGLIACVGWHDVTTADYDQADKRFAQAMSMGAHDQSVHLWLGWSYEQRKRFDEAIAQLQEAVVSSDGAVLFTAALGHAYGAAGKEAEAREVLNKLLARQQKEYVSPYEIAAVYAGLRDRDRAFEWLQKAYDERAPFLAHFRMDPRMRDLRDDPRFEELLRRMHFPTTAR